MNLIETLNRTIKIAMDEGRASSYEDAQTLFESFRLRINVRSGFTDIPAEEAAVLTLLNAAPKTFLGGVEILGPLDEHCTRAWFAGKPLGEIAKHYGVTTTVGDDSNIPTICVGEGTPQDSTFWLGVSIRPEGFTLSPDIASQNGSLESPIEAGVAAAGAALNEAFQHVYRQAPLAGQREITWSLPSGETQTPPGSLWLIGLGHLGQAFLWTGALASDGRLPLSVRLTDYDIVSWASLSTCLLINKMDVGKNKVDVIAEQLETLGIKVHRDCQRLDLVKEGHVQSAQDIAVVAVDNIALRRSLDRLKADCVLEAGIGEGTDAFTRIQLHAFPGQRKARDVWIGDDALAVRQIDITKPAYQDLLAKSRDECGTTMVAGRAIATPFIGAFAGSLLSSLTLNRDSSTQGWNFDVMHL